MRFLPNTGFIRGTNSPLTPLEHSKDIMHQYIQKQKFFYQMEKASKGGKPILVDDKQLKGAQAGDTKRFHFIPQYYGPGIIGQNVDTRGNEKSLDEFYMDIKVDMKRQAFLKKGDMTDIRTIWDIRDEFKSQLINWFANETEEDIAKAFTGYIYDGFNEYSEAELLTKNLVNGVGRCARSKKGAGSSFSLDLVAPENSNANSLFGTVQKTDVMNTSILDYLQDFALDANEKYPMYPYKAMNGEEYYVLLLHPKAAIALRQDPRWEKRALSNYEGVKSLGSDPIATGSMGVWEHIIVKESYSVRTQKNPSVNFARNLLYGANAVVLSYAKNFDYTEDDTIDYHNQFGAQGKEIRGCRKIVYDDVDQNVAQVITAI